MRNDGLIGVLQGFDQLFVIFERGPNFFYLVDHVVEVDFKALRQEFFILVLDLSHYRTLRSNHSSKSDDVLLHIEDVLEHVVLLVERKHIALHVLEILLNGV